MDAISVPSPLRLTPMISADRFSVTPDSSAAGTLLISWLAATPVRTSCLETSCYNICENARGLPMLPIKQKSNKGQQQIVIRPAENVCPKVP